MKRGLTSGKRKATGYLHNNSKNKKKKKKKKKESPPPRARAHGHWAEVIVMYICMNMLYSVSKSDFVGQCAIPAALGTCPSLTFPLALWLAYLRVGTFTFAVTCLMYKCITLALMWICDRHPA